MRLDEEQALLQAAAEPTFERIERDSAAVSAEIKPLLQHLRTHLLDPELAVADWFRVCQIRGSLIPLRFHREIGLAPGAYLWDGRLETASRLLLDTDLPIGQIGELVCYSGRQAFSAAFLSWCGLWPSVFREHARAVQTTCGGLPEQWQSTRFLREAMTGRLELPDAVALYDRLCIVSSQRSPGQTKSRRQFQSPTSERFTERGLAEAVWERLKDRPVSEQRTLVRQQLCFRTPALFDLLRHKSREEGRQDRQRGIDLAKLALASLEGCADRLPDDLPNRKAQGWVWLANAYRLALDFPAAEQAFIFAEAEWSLGTGTKDPVVGSELILHKAGLRSFQRRYQEAAELAGQAIQVFRERDMPTDLARALILRAGIQRDNGQHSLALSDLQEALELLGQNDDRYLVASANYHLTETLIRCGDFEAAAEALGQVRTLSQLLNHELGEYQVRWLEGLIEHGQGDAQAAEQALRDACHGFTRLNERGHAAVSALDLALLLREQDRNDEVLVCAAQALPILENFKIRPEVLAALTLLREAVETQTVSLAVLQRIRHCLEQIVNEPSA